MDKLDTLDFLDNKKRELAIISKLIDSTIRDKFDYEINPERNRHNYILKQFN